MQTSNGDQNIRSKHPEWYLLAEYALSEILPDNGKGDELPAGLLSQPLRALGIPLEYLEIIDMTLTGFAKEMLLYYKQGSLEMPGRIRVFCQRKMIDDANSAKTSRLYNAKQAMEHAQIIHPFGTKMNEGWGYYVIERGRDFASIPSKESCRVVEIYLYKEGK
jgi:hypothetical protein